MTIVREDHWKDWLGSMPMPEEATPDMMYAAYDALQAMEYREKCLRMIPWWQAFRKKTELRAKDAPAAKTLVYEEIIELLDKEIEFLTKEAVEG